MTIREVAVELGVATNTVAYHRDRGRPAPRDPLPDMRGTVGRAGREGTREAVAALLAAGLTRAEVATVLGISRPTVTYHAGRLGLPSDERASRRYDWAAIQRFYDAGHSVRECIEAFGFATASWHDAVRRGAIVPRPTRLAIDELCVAETPRSRVYLKKRLLEEGIKAEVCEHCGLTDWLGEPLSLALHHVNGDRHDNRLENLSLLCPNCHSQTANFAGRNRPRRAAAR